MAACLLLCGVLVWFLADAGQVRQDVSAALALCARSVIPALFPFLVFFYFVGETGTAGHTASSTAPSPLFCCGQGAGT